jgi:CubicO group peptidase (beta-lactamase class C family)
VLDGAWVDELRRPCAVNPQYGLLWWLNTDRQSVPAAPESCFAARGAGANIIWVDPEHDLVIVARWIDRASIPGFLELVVRAVR